MNKGIFHILLFLLILFNIFAGCGQPEPVQHSKPIVQPIGMYVDETLENFLKIQFDELKSCGNFQEGSFEDLSIIVMPPKFPCRWYENGCGGEFVSPNSIKISSHYYWKHELVHYFLYINTGDPDSNHESELYEKCS